MILFHFTVRAQGKFFRVDMSIVLAEDKKYYADPSDIYGGAETTFQPEDTQPIHVPIVASKRYDSYCCIIKHF